MNKLFLVMFLAFAVCAPSSFASDVVGHSAKVAGEDSAKLVAYPVKEVGKAGWSVVKFLF